MVLFSCPTCGERGGAPKMKLHLQESAHYSVIQAARDEILKCQECQHTGIRDLSLIQVGTSDYVLVCDVCKETEVPDWEHYPTTRLETGMLKLTPSYFTVRDLQCRFCDSHDDILVTIAGPPRLVCEECLVQYKMGRHRYLKRGVDDGFLRRAGKVELQEYHLPSILHPPPESNEDNQINTSSTSQQSPSTPPSSPPIPSQAIDPENSVNPHVILSPKPRGHIPLIEDLPAPIIRSRSITPSASRSSGRSTPRADKVPVESLLASYRQNYGGGNSSSSRGSTPKTSDITTGMGKLTLSSSRNGYHNKPSSSKAKDLVTFSNFIPLAKASMAKLRAENDRDQMQKMHDLSMRLKKRSITKDSSRPITPLASVPAAPSAPNPLDLPKPSTEFMTTEPASITEVHPHEEYEHIPTLTPRRSRLRYNSLFDYYREMSDHLYFEERLITAKIYPEHVEYHALDKSTFRLEIPYTDRIDDMVKRNLRELDMLPFYRNQSFFVGRDKDVDNVFHCFVVDVRLIKEYGTKTHIEVILELYFWNDSSMPLIGYTDLWLIPASPQICRVMTSMLRLNNKLFLKLLLGKEKIEHHHIPEVQHHWPEGTLLNSSQKLAVEHALQNEVSVIRGPPGTGKTTVIYNIIKQMLSMRKFPILVVAASNFAIDNIAEKFLNDAGTDSSSMVRILSREKEREYGRKHQLADMCLHHNILDLMSSRDKSLYFDLKDNRSFYLGKKEYMAFQARVRNARRKIISSKKVIFTTTVTAGAPEVDYSLGAIPVVIMDESTQSSEPTSLIPLSIPKVEKFVFVGDEKQLSSFSEIQFLEQSLFERMLKNGSYEHPNLLNVQYRMHPAISKFPNEQFYNSELVDGITADDRQSGYEPLMFFDYDDPKAEEMLDMNERGFGGALAASRSYINRVEAGAIIVLLTALIADRLVDASEIAVITPYSGQRDFIANLIKNDKGLNPEGLSITEEVEDGASITFKKHSTVKTIGGFTVASVDAFQGREKKMVIMSCVRSNEEGTIGFLGDKRRLNVALTRAKSCLFLFGNQRCLRRDKTWNALLDDIGKRGAIHPATLAQLIG